MTGAQAVAGEVAVLTLAHGRHEHLLRQIRHVRTGFDGLYVVVAIDDPQVRDLVPADVVVLDLPAHPEGLPLSAARNAAAERALDLGASTLVFLDVDCLPDPGLVTAYASASALPSLLCGPVTYLPDGVLPEPGADLRSLRRPHAARPAPAEGEVLRGGERNLFWSLSFAVSAQTWRRVGGFCEEYVGYGGEDTDFAWTADAAGIDVAWVGSAHAYHQHHPSQSPPVQHLAAIVRNANVFHRRWGVWPMEGWLTEFQSRGLVDWGACKLVVVPEFQRSSTDVGDP